MLPNKALQLTPNSWPQSGRDGILAAVAQPQRWRSALFGAAERRSVGQRGAMANSSIDVARDLRRIRNRRVTAVALLLALPLLVLSFGRTTAWWAPVLGFAWVVAFAVCGLGFLYSPCPRCSRLFFVPGDPLKTSWWFFSQFEANPLRATCVHCSQPLNPR